MDMVANRIKGKLKTEKALQRPPEFTLWLHVEKKKKTPSKKWEKQCYYLCR